MGRLLVKIKKAIAHKNGTDIKKEFLIGLFFQGRRWFN